MAKEGTAADCLQVIAIVAEQKGLELTWQPKKNMYIKDVAKFACVLLTTTEMAFDCGWQRIPVLFFCQLAAITASCPGALLDLHYWDMVLTLIQDPEDNIVGFKAAVNSLMFGDLSAFQSPPPVPADSCPSLGSSQCHIPATLELSGQTLFQTYGPITSVGEFFIDDCLGWQFRDTVNIKS